MPSASSLPSASRRQRIFAVRWQTAKREVAPTPRPFGKNLTAHLFAVCQQTAKKRLTAKKLFAICQVFAVCQRTAKSVVAPTPRSFEKILTAPLFAVR